VSEPEDTIESLLSACRRDHAAWINGDPSGYVLPDDATLMAAMGATGHGGRRTSHRQREGNSRWESGSGDVELVDGGVREDIAWLVMIERAQVKFAGRTGPERWDLRVTELFRKTDQGWERFHRHADPLVDLHSLDEMLALLA
jgi:ketosteroid isomerase-like protein